MNDKIKDLKIAKILLIIFVCTIIAETSIIYFYNPYANVKCSNCNSTNTEYWMDDEPDIIFRCLNCGAYFYQEGYIVMYDMEINKEYNKSLNLTNTTKIIKNNSID